MKRFSSHFLIAVFTFLLSVFGTAFFIYKPSKDEIPATTKTLAESKLPNNFTTDEKPTQTEPKSLSPYDIESFINNNPKSNLNILWQKLNISGKFNGLPDWEKNENFLEADGNYEAEIFQYNLDDESEDEILLRIVDNLQESCRYLLFKRLDSENNSWKLLGFIDHDFGRYKMPQHSFLLSGGKSFLVVKVQTQSGSGVALYTDRLFFVHNNKLIELLDYNSEGHQSMSFHLYFGDRHFTGRTADIRIQNNNAQVKVNFAVDYKLENGESDSKDLLWSKKQTAIFNISLKSGKKELDLSKSNISKKEIDSVYNVDSFDDNDFVKFNLNELKTLSSRKKIKEKEFWCMFICTP